MILNPEIIEDSRKYKCGKKIMKYLVFTCHLPLLGIDEDGYYFIKNEKLEECLRKMPIWLKLFK